MTEILNNNKGYLNKSNSIFRSKIFAYLNEIKFTKYANFFEDCSNIVNLWKKNLQKY